MRLRSAYHLVHALNTKDESVIHTIGMLVPSTNSAGEVEANRVLPKNYEVHAGRLRLSAVDGDAKGLDKLKVIRSEVPAITHVDFSARVQTVDAERHGRLYRLMKAFEARTGCPVLINTSFNVRGEPIVCTPEHAYHCFMGTDMDVLVMEDFLLLKDEQPREAVPERDEYLAQFALD